jgi:hypothetical protein
MNDSKNSSNGLLVLRIPQVLGKETVQILTDHITPIADQLGLEPMVLDGGADIRIENGRDALLERVCVALEEIAAQGRIPEVNVDEIAPQALNARASHPADRSGQIGGLNTRG